MRSVLVIQARNNSQRLPGKIHLPLGEGTVADLVAIRARRIVADEYWLATSDSDDDNQTEIAFSAHGFSVVRGSKSDVLSRFEMIIEKTEPDLVVRVTGDNPLLDYSNTNSMVSWMTEARSEVVSCRPSPNWPIGLLPEVARASAIMQVREKISGETQYDLSHVTSGLSRFGSIHHFPAPPGWQRLSNWRLTLDENKDYEMFTLLLERARNLRIDHTSLEGLRYLLEQSPSIRLINSEVAQKAIEEG